jgi:hypothetical protein
MYIYIWNKNIIDTKKAVYKTLSPLSDNNYYVQKNNELEKGICEMQRSFKSFIIESALLICGLAIGVWAIYVYYPVYGIVIFLSSFYLLFSAYKDNKKGNTEILNSIMLSLLFIEKYNKH